MAGSGRISDDELVPGLDLWYLKKTTFWDILNDWREKGERNKAFQAWGALYFFVFFCPLLLCGVWGPFQTNPDLEGLTLMILNPLAWAQTVIKFVILWQGIDQQAKVLDIFKTSFLTCVPEHRKDKALEMLSSAAVRASKLANLGIWTDFCTCTFWSIVPILRSEFFRKDLGITMFGYTPPPGHNKILGYWFPVDVDSTPWTQIIFVYEYICLSMAGFMIAIIEGLVIQLVLLYNEHMKVVQMLLEEMKESNDNLEYETLLTYVKDHNKLLKYSDYLQYLYNGMITFQMSTGLIILIITIFNFFLNTKNVDLVLMFKMVIFLMYTFIEVTVYCYVGDEMESTSDNMGFAAYCSEWYKKGIQFRKTIQMIIVRSMTPTTLRFGMMYPINLMALMNLLQTAYSTAMFMNNMTEGDD